MLVLLVPAAPAWARPAPAPNQPAVPHTRHHHHRHRPAWLRDPFHHNALCIHRYESRDWHNPGSPGGGMQFMVETWRAWGGGRYAAWPSDASKRQQLRVAHRVVRHDGDWHEWSTHSLCGL